MDLVNPKLAEGLVIETFSQWDNDPFAFWTNELILKNLEYSCDVFASFLCD